MNRQEMIILIGISIIIILCGGIFLWAMLFIETNNADCFIFYSKQYCALNNMTWDGYTHMPFPTSGFTCLQKLGTERIGFKEYEKKFYFSELEINECTDKPIINLHG